MNRHPLIAVIAEVLLVVTLNFGLLLAASWA
jgi:hypothetical protein